MRVRDVCMWLAGASALAACGGASAPAAGPATVEPPKRETPAERCLARARARREPATKAPDQIEVMHILVRHAESKVKSGIERSPEQACLRALEALEKLKGGAAWDDVVVEYSDEKGVETNFGNLGRISYDDVTPRFGDAAFALEVNELSWVVETASGYHVILRTE